MGNITQEFYDLKPVAASVVPKPKGTNKHLFLDGADNTLKTKDSSDVLAALSSGGGGDNKAAMRSAMLLNLPFLSGKFGAYNKLWSDGSVQTKSYLYMVNPRIVAYGAQLTFGNWTLGNHSGNIPGEAPGQNDIIVKCAIYNGSVNRLITFNGQTSVRISPGATVKSDPLPERITTGETYIRPTVSVDTLGQVWPIGATALNSANGDLALGGSINGPGGPGYHPFAFMGVPAQLRTYKSVMIVGDSIVGDAGDTTPDLGWAARGCEAAGIAWSRFAVGGAMPSSFNNTGAGYLLTNIRGSECIISELGVNGISSVATLAAQQALDMDWWSLIGYAGSDVLATTITPFGGNASQDLVRTKRNDWLRDGAPISFGVGVAVGTQGASVLRFGQPGHPLKGYVEVADLAETARNSGIWKPGYSNDNLHPNGTGHPALAPAIVATDYLL